LHVLSDASPSQLSPCCRVPSANINPTSDLNRLIMDYLVIEGYKVSAEEFSQEAGLSPPVDFESIEGRMNIREALQRGDVEDAITRVNDLNPEVCPFLRLPLAQKGEMIIPFSCTTLRPFRVGDETKHQNFSLQYDYYFFGFHFRWIASLSLIGPPYVDFGYEPGPVLSASATKADRIHPAREDRGGLTVRPRRVSAPWPGESRVPIRVREHNGAPGL